MVTWDTNPKYSSSIFQRPRTFNLLSQHRHLKNLRFQVHSSCHICPSLSLHLCSLSPRLLLEFRLSFPFSYYVSEITMTSPSPRPFPVGPPSVVYVLRALELTWRKHGATEAGTDDEANHIFGSHPTLLEDGLKLYWTNLATISTSDELLLCYSGLFLVASLCMHSAVSHTDFPGY